MFRKGRFCVIVHRRRHAGPKHREVEGRTTARDGTTRSGVLLPGALRKRLLRPSLFELHASPPNPLIPTRDIGPYRLRGGLNLLTLRGEIPEGTHADSSSFLKTYLQLKSVFDINCRQIIRRQVYSQFPTGSDVVVKSRSPLQSTFRAPAPCARSAEPATDCRCLCRSLMARLSPHGVEFKCRRCKRVLLPRVPTSLALGSQSSQGWADVELVTEGR